MALMIVGQMISVINTTGDFTSRFKFHIFSAAPHGSCCCYDVLPLRFHIVLLPAGGQDSLDVLGLLIERLIPGEPGLLTERSHGLDQLIHLRAQKRLSIARLDRFHLRRGRRTVPILHRDLVGRPMDRDSQIVDLAAQDQV